MAGFYPDVPAQRFAYHVDGTELFLKDSTDTLYDVTVSAKDINDESNSAALALAYRTSLIIVFPEKRDIAGYFWATGSSNTLIPQALEVSSDTTNGLDGTWTTIANPWVQASTTIPDYRTAIQTVAAGGAKAMQFRMDNYNYRTLMALHIYGTIPATENPDRLVFWKAGVDELVGGGYFDFGDITQGTSQTKQFRIKNNSSTSTATGVNLTQETVTYTMAVEFSADDVTYTPSLNIGDLAPGALSSAIYVRRIVPADESLRPQSCRFQAEAASWS